VRGGGPAVGSSLRYFYVCGCVRVYPRSGGRDSCVLMDSPLSQKLKTKREPSSPPVGEGWVGWEAE